MLDSLDAVNALVKIVGVDRAAVVKFARPGPALWAVVNMKKLVLDGQQLVPSMLVDLLLPTYKLAGLTRVGRVFADWETSRMPPQEHSPKISIRTTIQEVIVFYRVVSSYVKTYHRMCSCRVRRSNE
jgi:hypothetical protein